LKMLVRVFEFWRKVRKEAEENLHFCWGRGVYVNLGLYYVGGVLMC
jgi:hypothetical protein